MYSKLLNLTYWVIKKQMANFYNIANLIDKDYQSNYYVKIDRQEFESRLKDYITMNENLKTGDILFVGSEYETRQHYGFCYCR